MTCGAHVVLKVRCQSTGGVVVHAVFVAAANIRARAPWWLFVGARDGPRSMDRYVALLPHPGVANSLCSMLSVARVDNTALWRWRRALTTWPDPTLTRAGR